MQQKNKTNVDYILYIFDQMGVTTPKTHIKEIAEFMLDSEEAQKLIFEDTGVADIEAILEEGLEKAKNREKDHPAFQRYMELSAIAKKYRYKTGELKMPLEEGAEQLFRRISNAGGRIRIYSSGQSDSLRAGYGTTPLTEFIEYQGYHSSLEVGGKFDPASYKTLAKTAGVEISEVVYVTDDEKEAKAAVEAGVGRVYLYDKKAQICGKTKEEYIIITDMMQIGEDTLAPDHEAN